MTSHRGKPETDGVLAGHYKAGKVYSPPLVALGVTETDWYRSDVPDLLWPMALIATEGERGLGRFVEWQQRAHKVLEGAGATTAVRLDGRLTSLEAVDEQVQHHVCDLLVREMKEMAVLPTPLIAALRLYERPPGGWLLGLPWDETEVGEEDAISFLKDVVMRSVGDGHAEAMVKFVRITWDVLTKEFSSTGPTIDLLKVYPRDPETVEAADSVIRASFNAMKAAEYHHDEQLERRRETWAKRFWTANSRLSPCLVREEVEEEPEEVVSESPEQDDSEETTVRKLVVEATAEYQRFLAVLFGGAELDLHAAAKQEVISGLVSRLARATVAILRSPHMWCGEHGASHIRLVAETEILLVWLAQNEPQSYADYKSFGRGKAKLMKAHMEELAASFEGEPPERLRESLLKLDKSLGGDWGQELISVNLDSTFSGKSVRAMAFEAGLEDTYRYVYQPASGVGHGEWWTLEDYSLQRCLNPLHRFHWIPTMEPVGSHDPEVGSHWVSRLTTIVSLASHQLKATSGEPT